jgi:cystinosin
VIIFLVVLYLIVLGTWITEASGHPILNVHYDTFSVAGYAKASITFIKYTPQVYLNWKRQSTVGWSLANVLLDLTGGTLSLIQLFIDVVLLKKTLNPVAFILSVMSIIFDNIFLFQHYCLYSKAWKDEAAKKKNVNFDVIEG